MCPPQEPQQGIRLNRYLSMCGVASRRKSDELLLAGRVLVNGRVISELGTRIDPDRDKIYVDGKQVSQVHEYVYLVMNKPKDTITTVKDERGRATVLDLIHSKQRVYPVGRLDRHTTGVLLLTNDGQFAQHLMHPKFQITKSYHVTCDKPVAREHLDELRRGVRLDDGMTAPAQVVVVPGAKKMEIGIAIREGRNRQVRRMFEELGYEVKKLDRVAYGPVTKEGLPRGASRLLTHAEIRSLRRLSGLHEEKK